MDNILYAATVTLALMEVIKYSLIPKDYKRIVPLLSLIGGMAVGYVLFDMKGLPVVLVGLVASGTYDLAKHTYKTLSE